MFSYWFKPPLLIAAENNDLAKVRDLLVDATAETVNRSYGAERTTALMAACEARHTEIVLALLTHPEIDVNQKGMTWCPLTYAARIGYEDIFPVILAHPTANISESEALCCAARGGHLQIVRTLLAHPDVNVNFLGVDGSSALNCAVDGDPAVVEALLACPGIEVNRADCWDRAPLNNAAIMAYCDVVRLLLAHPDIDCNFDDKELGTPLRGLLRTDYDYPRSATSTADVLCTARLLLRHPGVQIDILPRDTDVRSVEDGGEERSEDGSGEGSGDEEAGAVAMASDTAARALLHNQLLAAVICGDEADVVESLLAQHDVDVNVLGVMKRRPLHWAAFLGHTEIVQLLLSQPGIDLSSGDAYGRTPLALAAKHGHAETVKVLLEAPGVVVNSVYTDAMRAVLFQMDQEFDESDTPVADLVATLQVLLAHPSIDLSVLVDKSHNPPDVRVSEHACFLAAVLCGDLEKVTAFLARPDINVNVISLDDFTALTWASYFGHSEIVQALLAHPQITLVPDSQIGQLRRAYCFAVRYNHLNIAKMLQSCLDPQCEFLGDSALLGDLVSLGKVAMLELLLSRPGMYVEPIKMHHTGRPMPERKLCEEMVRKAHAERLAQKAAVDGAQGNNKRRSWWDAFGLV